MINKKKKLFKIYFFIFIIVFSISFFIIENIKIYPKYSELDLQNKQINSKITNELERAKEIKSKLNYLESEEGQIRVLIEKNNLKRSGEKVIKILDY